MESIENARITFTTADETEHVTHVAVHNVNKEDFEALPVPYERNAGVVWKVVAGVTFFRERL